jgi:glycosyltransferase involved in cell wall biosynthesis
MLKDKHVLIVTSGLVEVPTRRAIPMGSQEIDYHISLELAKNNFVTVVGPFFPPFRREVRDGSVVFRRMFHPAISRSSKVNSIGLAIEMLALLAYSFQATVELLRRCQRRRIDFLIFSSSTTGIFPGLLARLLKVKVIFSEGNSYPWYSTMYFTPGFVSKAVTLLFGRLACVLSNKIRAQSISIKKGMIRVGIDPGKITVIPAGVDIQLFRPKLDDMDTEFTVGFVGRLTKEKGAPLLYEIAKKSSSRFQIVGTGEYESQVSSLEKVTLFRSASRAELARLMNQCDVFVAPHSDPSLTILEEMACGKPVIALRSLDMEGIIVEASNGLLCGGDSDAFCRSIDSLERDSHFCKTLGRNARQTSLDFSWERIGEKWENLISAC